MSEINDVLKDALGIGTYNIPERIQVDNIPERRREREREGERERERERM